MPRLLGDEAPVQETGVLQEAQAEEQHLIAWQQQAQEVQEVLASTTSKWTWTLDLNQLISNLITI